MLNIKGDISEIEKQRGLVSKQTVMNKTRQIEDYELMLVTKDVNIKKIHLQADEDHIALHGDGANWIKTGLEEIPNSKPVLDKFHMEKYIKRIYKNNYEYRSYIIGCLQTNRYNLLKHFFNTLVANEEITEQEAQEVYRYLFNNRKGIANALTLGLDGRSCAEGLVSHTLSERLSSRPCAWSEEGAANIASIRVFIKNGGKLKEENLIHYDEVVLEHQSRIREIASKRVLEAEHEFHIRESVPKRSDRTWLKDIARTLCS